ncbi:putative spermidine/putrescine transport system ATP-binding protein [Palleronia aestuarii]|uniref:Spermidine/putrescine import ATP-binding protein PotA n=1 Tax=Palleronia aestuarii TaxID=568105 RepID=A0A2W7MYS0_9RHOB|nr:ABC transporter ATP-binding protein [Palleronia aestuarii]PZX13098.1 putative spermidine/putrescine transport system ATP-binding protein [Palleronia aestuarii]
MTRDAETHTERTAQAAPIAIENITKTYDDFHALDDVSLEIGAGEFLTLLGPSGSGKTTLLMVLAGFTRPTRGRILVAGEEMTGVPPHKRDFGMVFQNYALFPHMSVFDNIAYPLKLRRHPKAEIKREVGRALELVHLSHLASRRISALSGGQKQRIALARAIVFEPRVLLMDEPLSALDKNLREQMQIEIRALHDTLGITTIYVTHDQREALTMSDRIVVIDGGRVSQVDTPRALYDRPANAFVAGFIGESTLLPVARTNGGYTFQGRPLKTGRAVRPDAGQLVVRPEKLVFRDPGQEEDHNLFEGTLQSIVYQGDTLLARIEIGQGRTLLMRKTTHRDVLARLPEPGGEVALALHADDTILVEGGTA